MVNFQMMVQVERLTLAAPLVDPKDLEDETVEVVVEVLVVIHVLV